MGSEVQDREFTAKVASVARGREQRLSDYRGGVPIGCVRPRAAEHRASDWRRPAGDEPAGPPVCGVCHPPPPGIEVERRAG